MTTAATVIAVAWLLTLTGLVLWAANAYRATAKYARDTNTRVDALEHRQDIVDKRYRTDEMRAWAARRDAVNPAQRPQERPEAAPAAPNTPRTGTEALRGSEPDPATIDADVRPGRPPVPPPPAAPTEAIRAIPGDDPGWHPLGGNTGAQTHRTEPITDPTPPRGRGRWVTGPGGSLVYRAEDDDR
jgi:hypothetical protein